MLNDNSEDDSIEGTGSLKIFGKICRVDGVNILRSNFYVTQLGQISFRCEGGQDNIPPNIP